MGRPNSKFVSPRHLLGGAFMVLTIMGLFGCNQYTDRQDPISLGVGDAVAENKVAQTVNPWPPGSKDPKHATNGARALSAVRRYENNEIIAPKPIRSQTVNKK